MLETAYSLRCLDCNKELPAQHTTNLSQIQQFYDARRLLATLRATTDLKFAGLQADTVEFIVRHRDHRIVLNLDTRGDHVML